MIRIALAQLNPVVGDLAGNVDLVLRAAEQAQAEGADLVVAPELVLTGYPPQDLLLRDDFLCEVERALEVLATAVEVPLLVGAPERRAGSNGSGVSGRLLHNTAFLLRHGVIEARVRKQLLPTYDVFDEDRYFEPGADEQALLEVAGVRLGVTVCEDMWNQARIGHRLHRDVDPVARAAAGGAQVLLNVMASPYHRGRFATRLELVRDHARRHGLPFLFVNQVGGNDDLLFDGGSLAVDGDGALRARARDFSPDLLLVDVDPEGGGLRGTIEAPPANGDSEAQEVYRALVMGTRDYARKCGFERALVGLSGGVDSALTAAVAVEALGPENVLGVAMPSRFSSEGSVQDAHRLAELLGVRIVQIPIEPMFAAFLRQLAGEFSGRPWDVTEENLQARIRGTLLMALSNKQGRLLLTTGNKSEVATGYCTLYGDMCGGLAVIADVPKTLVYRICRELNREAERIPWSTIDKPPSAELAPDQRDSDSLPAYEVLDPILDLYVEEALGPEEIVARGHERAVVERVVALVDRNEYKRRQAAPTLRVTTKAFGAGRQVPIAKRMTQAVSLRPAAQP